MNKSNQNVLFHKEWFHGDFGGSDEQLNEVVVGESQQWSILPHRFNEIYLWR